MDRKRAFLLLIICLTTGLTLFAQCSGRIALNSQDEVDAFIKNYGTCPTVDTINIYIECSSDRIRNLDSLVNIVRAKWIRITGPCGLYSIKGLRNLKYVDDFTSAVLDSLTDDLLYFTPDTIQDLSVTFYNDQNGLTNYRGIQHVRSISLQYTGKLAGLSTTARQSIKRVFIIDNNSVGDLNEIVSGDSLELINIWRSKNIEFGFKKGISYLEILSLVRSEIVNLDALANTRIRNLKSFNSDFDSLPVFTDITDLSIFEITNLNKLESVSATFPNLNRVDGYFALEKNENLKSIELTSLKLPYGLITPGFGEKTRLTVQDNPNLVDCFSYYLCEAYATYPDSVIFNNNGSICTKESIMEYCSTLSQNDITGEEIKIHPIPFSERFFIGGLNGGEPTNIVIRNLMGQIVYRADYFGAAIEVNAESLIAGTYLLSIENKESYTVKKIVKI